MHARVAGGASDDLHLEIDAQLAACSSDRDTLGCEKSRKNESENARARAHTRHVRARGCARPRLHFALQICPRRNVRVARHPIKWRN